MKSAKSKFPAGQGGPGEKSVQEVIYSRQGVASAEQTEKCPCLTMCRVSSAVKRRPKLGRTECLSLNTRCQKDPEYRETKRESH